MFIILGSFFKNIIKALNRNTIIKLFIGLGLIMVSASLIYYVFESPYNESLSLADSFWWCFVTLTTVGYGDYFPVSLIGRITAIIVMICGIGSFGLLSAAITSFFVEKAMRKGMGLLSVKCKDHYIIFGWNNKSKHIIEELKKRNEKKDIVVIANEETLEFKEPYLHYVKGDFLDEEVLKKSNAMHCHTAIVLADDNVSDYHTKDSRSVLLCLALDDLNPNIHIVSEVMDKHNVHHFQRTNANDLIITNEVNSKIILQSALSKRISNTFNELLTNSFGNELYDRPVHKDEVGMTFKELSLNFIEQEKGILMGLHKDNETMLNPPKDTRTNKDDILIYMNDDK